jgi:hypothetical protein
MEEFRREQADAAVIVLGVVPGREALAKAACILNQARNVPGNSGLLQALELTFRKRVVVGDVGRAEAVRPHRRARQPRQAARQKEAQLQPALGRRTGKLTEAGPAGASAIE